MIIVIDYSVWFYRGGAIVHCVSQARDYKLSDLRPELAARFEQALGR